MKTPKPDNDLKNNLKAVRTRLGLSQNELAGAAGIARQTIGGIEASRYAPSAAVALRLARTLGCSVEELFWLEEEPVQTVRALKARGGNSRSEAGERVIVGQVGGKFVAHGLSGEEAFRSEMIPADGIAGRAQNDEVEVQLLDTMESLSRSVLIAGCSPSLSLWTRSAQRWHPNLRANWIHANSTQALGALERGEVHIAGLHLCAPDTGEENVPFVRPLAENGAIVLINFGVWDEGLLVAKDNPKRIRGIADLGNENINFLNREAGAGSRMLFDTLLTQDQVPAEAISGYGQIATSHRSVANAIYEGKADAGMGTAAMAQLYNLDFIPMRQVRFDFAVRSKYLKEEPVAQLFETLSHKAVRLQLEKLGGYDTTRTGDVMARLG